MMPILMRILSQASHMWEFLLFTFFIHSFVSSQIFLIDVKDVIILSTYFGQYIKILWNNVYR
jgi:hypothetical protein